MNEKKRGGGGRNEIDFTNLILTISFFLPLFLTKQILHRKWYSISFQEWKRSYPKARWRKRNRGAEIYKLNNQLLNNWYLQVVDICCQILLLKSSRVLWEEHTGLGIRRPGSAIQQRVGFLICTIKIACLPSLPLRTFCLQFILCNVIYDTWQDKLCYLPFGTLQVFQKDILSNYDLNIDWS